MTSSGSLDTSANSTSSPFSFSNSFMTTSFSDLLTSGDAPTTATVAVGRGSLADLIAERTGSGVPKFKSIPPPSLPLSPPVVSPSSYFVIPTGASVDEDDCLKWLESKKPNSDHPFFSLSLPFQSFFAQLHPQNKPHTHPHTLFLSVMTSSGSLDTLANSTSSHFSFSNSFMTTSFSDLLTSGDAPTTATAAVGCGSLADHIAERTGSGVPKFKSIPPHSLPLSPPAVSPSSYFAIPPGLSPC
ncbi:hypothetical protein RJ640_030304 [Escallonia rubra]|uniref:Uncharacterized protein n=1 Tax=Escallonia rubra TaxID=112253 RepID=A0AA88QDC3_9ASTE|nr:hypothetical protein RJ640_030304 [Escallonia rubra]